MRFTAARTSVTLLSASVVLTVAAATAGAGTPMTAPVGLALPAALAVNAIVTAVLVRSASNIELFWRWIGRGVRILALGLVAEAGLPLLDWLGANTGDRLTGVPFELAVLVSAPCFYYGLIRWNRSRTELADPGDWLNGLSAVVAVAGIGVAIGLWNGASDATDWRRQLWLLAIGVAFVLAGACATIVKLASAADDPRAWIVLGGFLAILVTLLVGSTGGPIGTQSPWHQTGWALSLLLLAIAALCKPSLRRASEATPQETAVGALVVLAAGILLLAAGTRFPFHSAVPTVYALLAVIGASARGLHMLRDLTQLARTKLEATTDELTGIANRRVLTAGLRTLARSGAGGSLLVIDVNRFKEINDSFGHSVGDEVLRRTAGILSEVVGNRGLLARMGGDEFAILLADTHQSPEAAMVVARAVAEASTVSIEVDGRPIPVSVSIGVASMLEVLDDGLDLLRQADVAMYAAKHGDQGPIAIYDLTAHLAEQERRQLVGELRAALPARLDQHAEQLEVFYQPQVDLRSGLVVGAEALVRWRHPRLGLTAPDVFLPLAEEYGLMGAVTATVLRDAVFHIHRWQHSGRPLRVSVNLSASCLSHPDLPDLLDAVLAEQAIKPSLLTLEITESTMMDQPERALARCRELSERGVGISIDDYGTGYAALSYLHDLPADELKLDRSFTARLLTSERTAAIVAATVDLAHKLGLRLIAEGVEDVETLAALRQLACDETQGYLHSRPLPVAEFDTWLAEAADRSARPAQLAG